MSSVEVSTLSTYSSCPHCLEPVQIVACPRQEDESVHLVMEDGSREAVQTHFTEASGSEAGWTLPQWWSETVLPAMRSEGISAARISDYETYLRRWEAFPEHRTHPPVLCTISPATLLQWRTWLVSKRKLSAPAADKHVQGVTTLLRRAVDAWILPRIPRLKPLAKDKPAGIKWCFSAPDLDAMYQATEGVQWPATFADGVPCPHPESYWRAFLVGGWNYGFRTQEWWAYEGKMTPLVWDGVRWDPDIEVESRDVSNEHGWICWTQDKTGHRLTLPMNATVRRHLLELWDSLPRRRQRLSSRVWDFPLSAGTKKPNQELTPASGFYAAWWDLVDRAELKPKRAKCGRRLTHCPAHFRKTAHTAYRDSIGTAANWITGHSGRSIGEKHYYNAINKVIEGVQSRQQPSAFLRS